MNYVISGLGLASHLLGRALLILWLLLHLSWAFHLIKLLVHEFGVVPIAASSELLSKEGFLGLELVSVFSIVKIQKSYAFQSSFSFEYYSYSWSYFTL